MRYALNIFKTSTISLLPNLWWDMKRIFTISYVSRCIIPLEDRPFEIQRLVAVSTKNNAVRYISGLLALQDNQFLQVIEGEEDEIERTFSSIRRDMRHTDINVIANKEILQRQFSRWIFGLAGSSVESRAYFSALTDQSHLTSHEQLCRVLENLAKMDSINKLMGAAKATL